jgi:hypothetical protein
MANGELQRADSSTAHHAEVIEAHQPKTRSQAFFMHLG